MSDTTERALLAALISYPDEILEVIPLLKPEDFTFRPHEAIYAELVAMTAAGVKVDAVTLQNALAASGRDRAAGDMVLDLAGIFGGPGYSLQYARTVQEASQRREMRARLSQALEALGDATRPIQEIAGMAEAAALVGAGGGEATEKMVWEYMPEVFDVMERQSKGAITGLRTGLIDLDSHLSGLQRGDLIILGGRPRMGKTSLALDITGSVAIDQRKSVCFFSLEMAARQIVERHLFTRARVNGELLRKGKLPDREYPKLAMAAPQFNDRKMKWMIDGATMLTPLRMLSKVRRHRAKYGLDLVVIDNLQKMRPDSGQKDKRLAIAEISEALKNTAKDLDVPILAISHLSRGPDMRSDARPVLSDLQESGNIEQDADIVLFVYRESEYKDVPEDQYGDTELIIAKYRNGSPGDILLRFNHPLSSFENHGGNRTEPPQSYKDRQTSHGDFYGP
jgi:replicative DNA helicase